MRSSAVAALVACLTAALAGCGGSRPVTVDDRLLERGTQELEAAVASDACQLLVHVTTVSDDRARRVVESARLSLSDDPESFAAVQENGEDIWAVGRGAAGALYGALDLAERAHRDSACSLVGMKAFARAPAVSVRAANLFLVLPGKDEPAWWFDDAGFWTEYLDVMLRSRMNFLDLHGMYNPENTSFPNALLYFARSHSEPQVGIDPAARETNLAMLNRVIEMAAERGIKVGLMSYNSSMSLTGASPQLLKDDARIATYTREAAEDLARRAPGLWRLGFRIGESSRPAQWYLDTFIKGVHDAGTGVKIYTRTWLASHADIAAVVAAAGGGAIVEAKYNGEHLGPPYVIAGGEMPGWEPYSYQDYLDEPGAYDFVFQVRAGGTHRIFRHASYDRVRRMVPSFTLGGARGFTLEPTHAYFAQRDYYHQPQDKYSEWTFRRDELEYLLFGRLAYDPQTDVSVFQQALADRVGTDALWQPVQAASEIVPLIQTAHTCGPDHRDYAPDLEWGGTVGAMAMPPRAKQTEPLLTYCPNYHGPFDSFALAGPWETAQELVQQKPSGRLSSVDVARLLESAAAGARAAGAVAIDPANAEARDVQRETLALADLGDYYAHKLRAATALAVFSTTAATGYEDAARAEAALAGDSWRALAEHTGYILPFADKLRAQSLGLMQFHWREQSRWLPRDLASIDLVSQQVALTSSAASASRPAAQASLPAAQDWLSAERPLGPGLSGLAITPRDPHAARWTVSFAFERPVPEGATVQLLWKEFSAVSSQHWKAAPASLKAGRWTATVAGHGNGAFFAVQVHDAKGNAFRYPDVVQETPYVVLAPQ